MSITKSILISLLFSPFLVFAQAGLPAEGLPKAGLIPESPFYFLDKLGEALQGFFTFNPEGKARLQITFAAERVAEIKIILETKGVEAKGLEIAQSRLQAHLASAATIVANQKSKGKDVSILAAELDDRFEAPKSALAESFKEQKRALEAQEDELKAELRAAHLTGDTATEEALAQQLGQVKGQQELLELKEEDIEDELEAEEEKIEEELEAQHKAEEAIREAEEAIAEAEDEKQEIIDEAEEEDVEIPADAFGKFDSFLSQATSAFAAENFKEAKRLAEQAEKSLKEAEKAIEKLEKEKERQEEQAEKEEERKNEEERKQNEVEKDQERAGEQDRDNEEER